MEIIPVQTGIHYFQCVMDAGSSPAWRILTIYTIWSYLIIVKNKRVVGQRFTLECLAAGNTRCFYLGRPNGNRYYSSFHINFPIQRTDNYPVIASFVPISQWQKNGKQLWEAL